MNQFILLEFVVAGLGISLLAILFSRILSINNSLKVKKHRSTQEGLADLLNYAALVDDGVVVCKNGAMLAAWIYKGPDNASSSDEERNIMAKRINDAQASLGNGWMVHIDAVRRPAPKYSDRGASEFPDPVTAAIDEERRRLFEGLGTMYEGFFVITMTWLPPVLVQQKFVELMFDDESESVDRTARTMGLIDQFKNEIANIESRLSVGLEMQRLHATEIETEEGRKVTHEDLLSWLQFCVTGILQPIQLPENPIYLDALIGGKELWTGVVPKIGRNFISVVAIEGFPAESAPGILSALAEVTCEYRWSSRFIFMDPHEAEEHLEKFRKKWSQKIRGFFDQVFNTNSGQIDHDAKAMAEDAVAATTELKSGLVAYGYYTSNIILMDEDRNNLEKCAQQVAKLIMRLGFVCRIETINTVDAFFGSLPGHGVENVRRPLMNTMNLAHLIPTSSIWTGSQYAPCPFYPPLSPALMYCVTHGATPFRLNLHTGELGHMFMFGPTRAGKSTKLGILAAQLRRYKGMSIFAFDKGMSMYALTKAVGGQHFAIGADDDDLEFCPLQFLESKVDRAWAMEWIETVLRLNRVDVTPAHRNKIGTAIMSMHESGAKTLSEFSISVQDEEIREAIKQYTVDGAMGHLLDAEEDGLRLSKFTTFEIEELMNMGEKYGLPVLLYIFRRIERSLKGKPAAIFLDEAWLMLAHPAFREKIREWLKVLAKANCIVILATQNLSDAARSGILDVLVEATATKIFLPNPHARDEETTALYKRMGLNTRQIEILATAISKRQYYYVSDTGRRLYELGLGPLALSLVGVSDKETVAEVKKVVAKYGDQWIHEWLSRKGLKLSDYLNNLEAAA